MRRFLMVAVLLAAPVGASGAQQGPTACTKTNGTRVVAYASAHLADSAQRAFLPQANNLVDAMAAQARILLGSRRDSLPRAEPLITDDDFGGAVKLVAYRDGRMTWTTTGMLSYGPPAKGAAFLARAFEAARAAGELAFAWPQELRGDSVAFNVQVDWPTLGEDGGIAPVYWDNAVPLFLLEAHREVGVMPIGMNAVDYPKVANRFGATGRLHVEFVVDTTGRVDMASVVDGWPAGTPRPTGDLRDFYDSFFAAIKRALPSARYVPAQRGGCKVPMMVMQPFEFNRRP